MSRRAEFIFSSQVRKIGLRKANCPGSVIEGASDIGVVGLPGSLAPRGIAQPPQVGGVHALM